MANLHETIEKAIYTNYPSVKKCNKLSVVAAGSAGGLYRLCKREPREEILNILNSIKNTLDTHMEGMESRMKTLLELENLTIGYKKELKALIIGGVTINGSNRPLIISKLARSGAMAEMWISGAPTLQQLITEVDNEDYQIDTFVASAKTLLLLPHIVISDTQIDLDNSIFPEVIIKRAIKNSCDMLLKIHTNKGILQKEAEFIERVSNINDSEGKPAQITSVLGTGALRGEDGAVQFLVEHNKQNYYALPIEFIDGMTMCDPNADDCSMYSGFTSNLADKLVNKLKLIHAENIVHKDLHFGNIMITPDKSDVKIIDWGEAEDISSLKGKKRVMKINKDVQSLIDHLNMLKKSLALFTKQPPVLENRLIPLDYLLEKLDELYKENEAASGEATESEGSASPKKGGRKSKKKSKRKSNKRKSKKRRQKKATRKKIKSKTISKKQYKKLLRKSKSSLKKKDKKTLEKALNQRYCSCLKKLENNKKLGKGAAFGICGTSVYLNRGYPIPSDAAKNLS